MSEKQQPVTVATGGVPVGYRLGVGWEVVVAPDGKCSVPWHDRQAGFANRRAMESACDLECAISHGALVPIGPARSVPPGHVPAEVPFLVSKLGERICDCGDSEQEHSGRDKQCPRDQGVFSHARHPRPSDAVLLVGGHCSGWGVNCAWKGCSFRTPEFTVAWAAREAIVDHVKSMHLTPAIQPAAPASEPAVRPLLWERMGKYRPGGAPPSVYKAFCDEVWTLEVEKVPRLEAELAEAKRDADVWRGRAESAWCERNAEAIKNLDAARAEVEQLRGKLAEVERGVEIIRTQAGKYGRERDEERTVNDAVAAHAHVAEREATARVRSMREACAGRIRGWASERPGAFRLIEDIASDIESLPLDTGTATDTGGEAARYSVGVDPGAPEGDRTAYVVVDMKPHADAIKAAVDKANNRAADAFRMWRHAKGQLGNMRAPEFEAWLRSGEDAPGAVGK